MNPTRRSNLKRKIKYLMTEANTENLLFHGVQFIEQNQQFRDPEVVAVGVIAAASDDEAVVIADLIVGRKIALGHPENVPDFAFLLEHSDENAVVAAVDFLHVVGVVGAEKHGEFLASHSLSLSLSNR